MFRRSSRDDSRPQTRREPRKRQGPQPHQSTPRHFFHFFPLPRPGADELVGAQLYPLDVEWVALPPSLLLLIDRCLRWPGGGDSDKEPSCRRGVIRPVGKRHDVIAEDRTSKSSDPWLQSATARGGGEKSREFV